jgi:hypothetical protein
MNKEYFCVPGRENLLYALVQNIYPMELDLLPILPCALPSALAVAIVGRSVPA